MVLDFKEIPKANGGDGMQDSFELFSRDFLQTLGYKILQHPDRGADGKKDIIVQESRIGVSGITHIKWLVSCKHYAHTGKSVSDTDELNILDRVNVHDCQGFLGFYSTLPATSLGKNFDALKQRIEIQSFDRERIEMSLLESPQGLKLASRYFPISYSQYLIENPNPAKIFSDEPKINCEYCGKNLLDEKVGIFVLLREPGDMESEVYVRNPYKDAYFSCKGHCDRILKSRYFENGILLDEWADISDFLTPTSYIRKQMAWMNAILIDGEKMETPAFDKLKRLFLNTFPYVSREQTSEEKERIARLLQEGFGEFI